MSRDEAAWHAHGVGHVEDVVPVKQFGLSSGSNIGEDHADGCSSSVKESGQGCNGALVELLPGCRAEVENVLIGLSWRQSELHQRQAVAVALVARVRLAAPEPEVVPELVGCHLGLVQGSEE